jgi:TatA/E family protein of Tat protein translocase
MILGVPEWLIIILAVLILLLGPKQLPRLARSAGKSLRIFKKEFEGSGKKKKK